MNHAIDLPGHGRIHAESDGNGPAIVFVHADFVDGRMWDGVRARLAARYRTVAYDKLGYGRSDPATGPVVRRRELAAVVDALGLSSFHLVGCSNGGQQALDFTLEHPARVRSLSLVNASPSGWQPQGDMPPLLMEMFAAVQAGDAAAASELQLRIWFDGPERDKARFSPAIQEARALASVMNRIYVERGTFFLADAQPLDPLSPPALSRLAELQVPTLVIDGRGDWSENRRASRLLAEGIPGARRIEVEGGHVAPLEDPSGFAALLERI
ncbi:MAG TPA: alpha/beta hydrolase [Spirochaetales bacterium]|nr:alpha/beta hydrolase [Spirochaetales bacterium]HRY56434.1 alpha/beta hydrolase [Spirochaetia bacterium]HRZ63908.1 alpha/beta hydrolase [Spirochaetia bacterium]